MSYIFFKLEENMIYGYYVNYSYVAVLANGQTMEFANEDEAYDYFN